MQGAWKRIIGAALCLAFALPAQAAPPKALRQAVRLYEALEYQKAAPRFRRIMTNGALGAKMRATAAVYHAVIQLALGREEKARESFAVALNLDSEVDLPADSSPAIREVFDEVREATGHAVPSSDTGAGDAEGTSTGSSSGDGSQAFPPDDATDGTGDAAGDTLPAPPTEIAEEPLMHHQPPAPGSTGGQIEIALDPLRRVTVSEIEIHHRRAGEAFWFSTRAASVDRDHFAGEIPAPSSEAAIEYYLEARDPSGVVVAALGSVATPFTYALPAPVKAPIEAVTPAPKERDPGVDGPGEWYEKWWVWAGAGAVTAGIVTGIVIAASGGCKAPDGQGCVEVNLR